MFHNMYASGSSVSKKLTLIFSAILITVPTLAVDVSGVTVNGEVAFDYNSLSNGNNDIPFTGGATNETYRLSQTQILAKKETDEISFLARLVYIPSTYVTATTPATTTNKSNLGTLDQIEVYYKIQPNFSIGFGRFLTTMGYESLLRSENANYGNTIAFQAIVPGYGEGLRAKYVYDYLTLTASTYNQSTYNAFGDDYTPTKTTEVSALGVLGNFSIFAGYYTGKDTGTLANTQKTASSAWASYKVLDNLLVALTYDARTAKPDELYTTWSDSSSALLTYGWGKNNFAVRYELVRGANELVEGSGTPYGTAKKVTSITVTDKIALNDNFKLYVEYRTDKADENVLKGKDGVADKDTAGLFTLGLAANF